jgi:16S rRNA (cytidine1402-2'-O)-methyltransferase
MSEAGRLWLVPVTLGEDEAPPVIPAATLAAINAVDLFIVESARSARAFLKSVGYSRPLQSALMNEVTADSDVDGLLDPIAAGRSCVLLSDAGAPCVADPGARVVARAHERGIAVSPMVGPSSLLLALMACGLEGQRFTFRGYLPVERPALDQALLAIEQASATDLSTQLWIEAPYRNDRMRTVACEVLQADTRLCIAVDLTQTTEAIRTAPVADWRANPGESIDRRPAIFLLLASSAAKPSDRTASRGPHRRTHPGASRSARRNSRAR